MISSRQPFKHTSHEENLTPMLNPVSVSRLMEEISLLPFDRKAIPQESLDLANKFRTSLFPWRGQFSPELVELFLDRYSNPDSVILDPFVGSGTALFEASRKGLVCYAAEINPSAIEMARTIQFTKYSLAERKRYIQLAMNLAEKNMRPLIYDLFSYQDREQFSGEEKPDMETLLRTMAQEAQHEPLIHNLLVNAIIRYMSYRSSHPSADFIRALWEHSKIIGSLPYARKEYKVFHADARAIPLSAKSIDLIITSPPYINVFNYHQNNRPAMELVGWNLLEIARSEIGSNRKHRQNRFLTVVQYTLDMLDVLQEMQRLLRPHGRAIIVVGRESKIRGISFRNGRLVAALATGGTGLEIEMLQERKFINKFGETIYEDILHLVPGTESRKANETFARSVAVWSLLEAVKTADEQVGSEILEAIQRANTVQKSPLHEQSVLERGYF